MAFAPRVLASYTESAEQVVPFFVRSPLPSSTRPSSRPSGRLSCLTPCRQANTVCVLVSHRTAAGQHLRDGRAGGNARHTSPPLSRCTLTWTRRRLKHCTTLRTPEPRRRLWFLTCLPPVVAVAAVAVAVAVAAPVTAVVLTAVVDTSSQTAHQFRPGTWMALAMSSYPSLWYVRVRLAISVENPHPSITLSSCVFSTVYE